MAPAGFRVEPLTRRHNRAAFSCGVEELDRYLRQHANQDRRRFVTAVYVLVPVADEGTIAGYYTLSSCELELAEVPQSFAARLPRYPALPAILLGRLAIDQRYQGRSIGGALLANALSQSWAVAQQIGAVAVVVDAKSESAAGFYKHQGFQQLTNRPNRLFLPMKSIEAEIGPAGEASQG